MNKEAANNWNEVETNFNQTLRSIFNQIDTHFKVFVGYTDMPQLYDKYDNRLQMIPCNTPMPQNRQERLRDRGWKLSVCAHEIYKQYKKLSFEDGGGFVFPVDADDFVNRHISEYCNSHSDANGFKSRKAYKYIKGKKYLEITPYFGGTMNIMKLYESDLIFDIPDVSLCFDFETACELHKSPVRWTDFEVEKQFADLGRPFSYLPFKSTIYCLGTGDNLSDSDPRNKKDTNDRFHPIAFLRKISPFNKKLLTKKINKDFGIIRNKDTKQ